MFVESNQNRARDLKKRLKDPTKYGWTDDQIEQAKLEVRQIKTKTKEDIIEEAAQHLELDNPASVEAKKKGISMSFLNEGHPLFKDYVKADLTMMQPVKAKLRNFTEEEKEDIKEKVKQIRQDRESMATYQNPGNRFMASIRRANLNSRGSMQQSDS